MPEMTTPESRARLGYLLSEMLSLPTLPADLSKVIKEHLQRQLDLVNFLKPEYCLRLYPVIAELAELSAKASENASSDEADASESPAAAASGYSASGIINGAAYDSYSLSAGARDRQDEQSEGY
jgi:hypothetical protein